VEKGMAVVATSSTCTFTLRDEYEHLLGLDNHDVRESIDLATKFIYNLLCDGNHTLKFNPEAPRLRVAYHSPCHLERLGWTPYSIELLKLIPNVELVKLDSQCCGIAGTYGFKKENYQTSQAIGEPLFAAIEASECDVVSTDCETCKWQIEMSTTKKVLHPIEILASFLS
jgi:glycerol-3-phosphate dehydrogenase subunit C